MSRFFSKQVGMLEELTDELSGFDEDLLSFLIFLHREAVQGICRSWINAQLQERLAVAVASKASGKVQGRTRFVRAPLEGPQRGGEDCNDGQDFGLEAVHDEFPIR